MRKMGDWTRSFLVQIHETEMDPKGLQRLKDIVEQCLYVDRKLSVRLRLTVSAWMDEFVDVVLGLLNQLRQATNDEVIWLTELATACEWVFGIAKRVKDLDLRLAMRESLVAKGFTKTLSKLIEAKEAEKNSVAVPRMGILRIIAEFHAPFVAELGISDETLATLIQDLQNTNALRFSRIHSERASVTADVIANMAKVPDFEERAQAFWLSVISSILVSENVFHVDYVIFELVSINDDFARQIIHAGALEPVCKILEEREAVTSEGNNRFVKACVLMTRLSYYPGFLIDDITYWKRLRQSLWARLEYEMQRDNRAIMEPTSSWLLWRAVLTMSCNPNLRHAFTKGTVTMLVVKTIKEMDTKVRNNIDNLDLFLMISHVLRFMHALTPREELEAILDTVNNLGTYLYGADGLVKLITELRQQDKPYSLIASLLLEMSENRGRGSAEPFVEEFAGVLESPELELYWKSKKVYGDDSILQFFAKRQFATFNGSFLCRLAAKFDVAQKDIHGQTPLMFFVECGPLTAGGPKRFLNALLEDPRSDRYCRDNQGLNVFDHYLRVNSIDFFNAPHYGVVKAFLDHNLEPPPTFWDAVFPALDNAWQATPRGKMTVDLFSCIQMVLRRTPIQLTFQHVCRCQHWLENLVKVDTGQDDDSIPLLEMLVFFLSRGLFLTVMASSKSRVGRASPLKVLPTDLFRRVAAYLPAFPPCA